MWNKEVYRLRQLLYKGIDCSVYKDWYGSSFMEGNLLNKEYLYLMW